MDSVEIVPGVHFLHIPDRHLIRLYGVNIFLVGDKEVILIDSGDGHEQSNQAITDLLTSLGNPKLAYILITHGHDDHYGGVPALKAATGAKVATHRANLSTIEEDNESIRIDVPLQGGETLHAAGVELTVIHTPGHSAGDICLYDPRRNVLFTGDTVVGTGTVVVGLHASDTMSQYVDSLRRLQALGAKTLCPGHGPVVDDARLRIQEVLDHRLMREHQIVAALAEGAKTAKGLVAEIYTDVDVRLHGLAESNVLAHLLKLENEGRVLQTKESEESIFALRPGK